MVRRTPEVLTRLQDSANRAQDKAFGLLKFKSLVHDPRVTSRVGTWLGIAFTICFVTGVLSHFIQHPAPWFYWPSRPINLYRITQGAHVISGVAAIPLLIAKLWTVYPKLFERPAVKSLLHALERISILVLAGAAFFELATGTFNAAQNYPWSFFFPTAHYAVAWVAFGSLLVHIAVKLPLIREHRRKEIDVSRRAFLRTTWLTSGVAVLVFGGSTIPFLRNVSALSERSNNGEQGLPVNRTAAQANVVTVDSSWRLEVAGPNGTTLFSREQLQSMRQTTAALPIACVEGWSQTATWSGVPVMDLLKAVGAPAGSAVRVSSLERAGLYNSTTLPGVHTSDPLTLLALRLEGKVLDLDHGYPCRIIAPSRPGVLQTKWVRRLEVIT
ncbi:molybdopterin-dependent oxidoreductase-like protein [Kutzneria buriramensis]|uniref:Molybdopterin-dependent oxidoreductase-like protein n=1 Tax=Kutzneria buriramensis TaxID=1045776 RepID=A0A3E0HBF0_9PSEU|nr:molybdopterin-dependent oxidoreductase-like protein [Kutzneria buriramensis]